MSKFFNFYQKFLGTYPHLTQGIQTAFLMATSDVIAQTVVEKKAIKEVNFVRTAQFASVGLILVGPALTSWYRFLNEKIKDTTLPGTLKKVARDQLLFAPPFISIFICSLGIAQMQPASEIVDKLQKNYTDILLNNYKVWPMVQICNFSFVPLQYQVLVAQIVAVFWNTYLSWKTKDEDMPQVLESNF